MSKTKQIKPVPKGFHTIAPYLVINGASKAIEFYKKAFNAKILSRNALPDGRILNAQMKIGDSIVMLSEEFTGSDAKSPASLGTSTVTLHVYSKDAEELGRRMTEAFAKGGFSRSSGLLGRRYFLVLSWT